MKALFPLTEAREMSVNVAPKPFDSACGLKTAGDRKIAPAALVRRAIHPMHAHLTHNGIGLNFSKLTRLIVCMCVRVVNSSDGSKTFT